MNASVKNTSPNQVFTLELTFVELQIINNAMSAYLLDSCGQFDKRRTSEPNLNHIEAAEKLSDELLSVYCQD